MALFCGSMTSFTGINFPKPPLPIQKFTVNTTINYQKRHLGYEKIFKPRTQYFIREGYGAKYAISVGRRNHELSLHNNNNGTEPFWLAPTKGFIRGVRSVFSFLAGQPSQLKYIEWPGFQNTVKTAVLTLVLVAMLIVVLSSVDSGLWYLLTSILRKPA
ncbi:putative protein translocase complex, SecE/Sec61-gamma subunit [Helianthus annuus]|uniref:Protein translocase subunit SecE n=2 Tax=Helianthus annuus TaxID=4232 RepID=A0A9K3HXF3_HELAN|nr:uncharacterized protein LOC110885364 [Helianthus annuus]KAF5786251.1 putative protein translocase complex, SecE/Sec61-gamma subunit [Helianthus annuus]KAJ0513697.1 putative protein translocase complex, SecE/Sec61-gamma subunit, SecE superfamily [Helianthus annuus]KAJ0521589.1 putative protein translocase complex, SecE/Sec61-gamma subunit [Helianthus annuus]KAJ0529799.1 putative protein translocase complex, SecE/Sec61-gamma subunit, SecE superfamily [Helianthus annuus]KAJ0696674.1 putative p